MQPPPEREDIESLLGIRIRDITLYRQALLHKSALKIYKASQSYERLEDRKSVV